MNISEPRLQSPLFAMMGDEESKVAEISNWQQFTQSIFSYEIYEGGHFFIHKHPEKIATAIKSCYANSKKFNQ
jgi:surfactin synthase thioesterase subunit